MHQEEIAIQAGCSIDTVSRCTAALRAKGELKVLKRTKRTKNGIQRLSTIYSVKYVTERNLRWIWYDRSRERAEEKAASEGKLKRLTSPQNAATLPAECGE